MALGRSKENSQESIVATEETNDGDFGQGDGTRHGKKGLHFGYILKVSTAEFSECWMQNEKETVVKGRC